MSEDQKRPEATHRQRAELGNIPLMQWPCDAEGNPMAIVSGCASDLIPTVQFGNLLVGPVTIMRPVSNESLESVIEDAKKTQQAAEFVCGSERRIINWNLDPSTKIINPATGVEMPGPNGATEPTQAASAPPVQASPDPAPKG
jgi:hypothetical protein